MLSVKLRAIKNTYVCIMITKRGVFVACYVIIAIDESWGEGARIRCCMSEQRDTYASWIVYTKE